MGVPAPTPDVALGREAEGEAGATRGGHEAGRPVLVERCGEPPWVVEVERVDQVARPQGARPAVLPVLGVAPRVDGPSASHFAPRPCIIRLRRRRCLGRARKGPDNGHAVVGAGGHEEHIRVLGGEEYGHGHGHPPPRHPAPQPELPEGAVAPDQRLAGPTPAGLPGEEGPNQVVLRPAGHL